ncbi:MAG: heme exporter protein CcmB [Sedimenticolaceae bacterium]|nr:heme exporter protein CcmB [Sedimenticolaceae bacterium]
MTSGSAFLDLLRRDLLLAMRRRSELANPMLFFVMVIVLFPLGVGAEPKLLEQMSSGVVWVAALLAALLTLDSIFRSDFEDGSLEQILFGAHPVTMILLAKVIAHWLVTGLPLLLVAPVLATFLGMNPDAIGVLMLSLLLGTPVLSLIGSIGVALTVGLRRGGVILSLLVLPLYVPVLIFGAAAVDAAASGMPVTGQMYIMAAFLVLAVTLAPLAAAAALRISLS